MPKKRKVKIGLEYSSRCTWVNHLAQHPDKDDIRLIKFGSPEFFTTSQATYIAKHLLVQFECNIYIYDEYVTENDYEEFLEVYKEQLARESA